MNVARWSLVLLAIYFNYTYSILQIPDQSPNDHREYRIVTLVNQLDVLLISDPKSTECAAALDVNVGYQSDPDYMPGLAHFCEHMLFLGSKKYPQESGFQQFIAENGGSTNAYTVAEHTNFYFGISKENFHDALELWTEFFIAPLFDLDATLREINAVGSEAAKNLQSDVWRQDQLIRSLSNLQHPLHRWGTGNYTTLYDWPKSYGYNPHTELVNWYNTHYSSNLMKLVIYGTETLDELETLAVSMFTAIPNRNLTGLDYKGIKPYLPQNLGRETYLIPVKDLNQLLVYFPIYGVTSSNDHKTKGLTFVTNLLGDEQPGSVAYVLKEFGWILSLQCGMPIRESDFTMIQLTLDLTETGSSHTDDIISVIFNYIALLQNTTANQRVYQEMAAIAQINWLFQPDIPPLSYVSDLALAMQLYESKDVLSAYYLFKEYDTQTMETILSQMTPQNMKLMFVSDRYENKFSFTTEPWYVSQYFEQEISAAQLSTWNITSLNLSLGLFMPASNQYIPYNLTILTNDSKSSNDPLLLLNYTSLELWYQFSSEFEIPTAKWHIQLETPIMTENIQSVALGYLYSSMVSDSLMQELYPAMTVGFTYAVNINQAGLSVTLTGYRDKLSLLVDSVSKQLFNETMLSEGLFEQSKETVVSQFTNYNFIPPYQLVSLITSKVLYTPNWGVDEVLSVMKDLTYDDMHTFIGRLSSRFNVKALVYGNVPSQDITHTALTSLKRPKGITLESEFTLLREVMLEPGVSYFYVEQHPNPSEPNNVIQSIMQIGNTDLRQFVLTDLVGLLIKQPFFTQIRTQEQLGYAVFSVVSHQANVNAIHFIIQSNKDPFYLDERIELFLANQWMTFLDQLTDDDVADAKSSLAELKKSALHSFLLKDASLWQEVFWMRYDWNQTDKYLAILESFTKQDLVAFTQLYLNPESVTRRRLVVQMPAGNRPFSIPYTNSATVKVIDDISRFKLESQLWSPLPPTDETSSIPPVVSTTGYQTSTSGASTQAIQSTDVRSNGGLVAAVVIETVLLSVILVVVVCLATKFRHKWQGWTRMPTNAEEMT